MNLTHKLDWLIDQWCERRALRPLGYLLRAYPSALVHTDQFGELLAALKDVKGLCRDQLPKAELDNVISSIQELEVCLKQRLRG